MNKIKTAIVLYWLVLLLIPFNVLIGKLTEYLYNENFQEWWTIFLYIFIVPITVIIIGIIRQGFKKDE